MDADELAAAELHRVGYWLRVYAHERGISITELIKRSGLSQSTAYTALKGDANPTIRTLSALSAVLDIRLVQLLHPTPEELMGKR